MLKVKLNFNKTIYKVNFKMSLNFAYASCLAGSPASRAEEAISNQRFSYGNVTYASYSELYKPCEKNARIVKKVIAPVCGIGYGIVLSVYQLALALFIGVPKMMAGKSNGYFKAHYFTAVRNVEHGFGWLATIFNDKWGSYLVEDAQHHKCLYQYFISETHVVDPRDSSRFREYGE